MSQSFLRKLGFRRRHLGRPLIRDLARPLVRAGIIPPTVVNGAQLNLQFQVNVNGIRFHYHVQDEKYMDPIGAALYWHSWAAWEPRLVTLFSRWAAQSNRVIDVGANTGYYTLLAAAHGCRVMAFEPNPEIFPFLQDNVRINGFQDLCDLMQLAAGEEEKEVQLYIHEDRTMGSMIHPTAVSQSVLCRPLDDCVPMDGATGLVKIDAEGAEKQVLAGMSRLIRNSSPRIIFECFKQETATEVERILRNHSYRLFWIDAMSELQELATLTIDLYGDGDHNFAALPQGLSG